MKGKLFLVPTILSEDALAVIPEYVHQITREIRVFFVENERTCRRYLRKTGFTISFDAVTMLPLNEQTEPGALSDYMQFLLDGNDCAVMSEAGVPAVADPGHALVRLAHENNIAVVPLVGPSSIILALMASGFNGQQFNFRGYIPVKQPHRNKVLQQMESDAGKGITQIFIETPYRNNSLLQDIIKICRPSTQLCIAMDLTGKKEFIRTQNVGAWKSKQIHFEKLPAIFLIGN